MSVRADFSDRMVLKLNRTPLASGKNEETKLSTREPRKPPDYCPPGDEVRVRLGKRKASPDRETPRTRESKSRKTNDPSQPGNRTERPICEVNTSKADFKKKYHQLDKIGEGGFGSVFAGVRIGDGLPVAIKYVRGPHVEKELRVLKIPLEVALIQIASGRPESVGKSAAVSLLDWYYLDKTLVMVMERPLVCMDLFQYIRAHGQSVGEHRAKVLMAQLVEAAIEMHQKGVLHRDLKMANILVEVGSSVPRVRIIDFGCGALASEKPYHYYCGTLPLAPPEWHSQKTYRAGPITVWQLGALLYRMLHSEIFDTMRFVGGHLKIRSKLSQQCRDFLQLCLAIDPTNRGTLSQLQSHPWLKKPPPPHP